MKNLLLLLVCLMAFSLSYAQNTVAKKKKNNPKEIKTKKNYLEFGVNVTGAIAAGGFHFTDKLLNTDPYFLHLKFVSHKIGLRTGAGFVVFSDKKAGDINGQIISKNAANVRLGLDYQVPIDQHWRLYYGADVTLGKSKDQGDYAVNGVVTKIRSNSTSFGIGPLVGLQYHLNQRISFQTEGSLYLTNTKTHKEVTYSDLPGVISPSYRNNWNVPIGVPRSLFVIIRF